MRILVTGGAGFIGSWVVRAYLDAGHQVAVVDNLSTGRRERVDPRARFYRMDLCDPALVDLLREFRPQVVSHHAAQASVAVSVACPQEDARSNVLGTLNLLEACVRTGVERVLYASTGGALYGECERPAREDDPPRPASPYGVTKYTGELYLQAYSALYGLAFAVLRYANVYGPGQDPEGEAGVVAIFARRMVRGEPVVIYGDGRQVRDFVFVGDVAEANLRALEAPTGLTVNIASGRAVSVLDLFHALARLTGYDRPPVYAPPRPGDLRRSVLDPSRARRDLGWVAHTPLEEGLARTVAFYREGGGADDAPRGGAPKG